MGTSYRTGSGPSEPRRKGECWSGSNASTTRLPYKTSVSDSEFYPERSHGQDNRHLCCFCSIIIRSKPQPLDRDLSSTPDPFPQVGIPACCERYLFLHLGIFVDQARPRQPPECTTLSPKRCKCSTFEIARDDRVLKDLRGVNLAY